MDNVGIGDNVPAVDIHVLCECGRELKIDLEGWTLSVKGELVFECPCGLKTQTVKDMHVKGMCE